MSGWFGWRKRLLGFLPLPVLPAVKTSHVLFLLGQQFFISTLWIVYNADSKYLFFLLIGNNNIIYVLFLSSYYQFQFQFLPPTNIDDPCAQMRLMHENYELDAWWLSHFLLGYSTSCFLLCFCSFCLSHDRWVY
jgi:hypothetical protein